MTISILQYPLILNRMSSFLLVVCLVHVGRNWNDGENKSRQGWDYGAQDGFIAEQLLIEEP